MVDIFVGFPGASAKEVEERVTKPMEKLLWRSRVSSTSTRHPRPMARWRSSGSNRRKRGKRHRPPQPEMYANFDLIPPGASPPLVKPRSIDDVPILALTLHSKRYNDFSLRQMAAQVHDAIKQVPNVSEVTLLGGQRRQLRVTLDAGRLAAFNLSPLQVVGALQSTNSRLPPVRRLLQPRVHPRSRLVPARLRRRQACCRRGVRRQTRLSPRRC